ncbi:MAG: FtsX-like permease family protein [Clostridium sp.]|uniref:ABC transporter permease n=1 Tax=Clostridium sp. TaxID=1506 RepID=UPI00303AD79D
MTTISKIANGSLKTNKSKSVLIVITIMLTTILLTSVGITCANWAEMNMEVTIERSGSYHAIYKRTTVDDLKVMENNIDLEQFGVMRTVGDAEYEENNLSLTYTDENNKVMSNIKFIEGNMPTKVDEIAIQDGYLKLLGLDAKVGEKIKIEYESRLTEELKIKEFTVSGLMETSDLNAENKRYAAIISEEFLAKEESSKDMEFNAYVRVAGEDKLSGKEIEAKAKSIAEDIGINEYEVKLNEDYINATKPDTAVLGGGLAVVIIVILSSVLVIYSIFYVSIITKVQEYGKLRAVGAAKKQIKGIILREGMVLASIAIPLGLVIGYFIGNVVIKKLLLMDGYNVGGFNLPIMVSVLMISYLTVFASLIKPMKIASKVSPVEAMRYNGEEDSRRKDRKGYVDINLKRLTYANLSRNKKRTVITLASLALSGILFITMSTIMSSMDAEHMAREHMLGDFKLSLANYTYGDDEVLLTDYNIIQENNPLGNEFREELIKIPGVEGIKTSGSSWVDHKLPSGEKERNDLGGFGEADLKKLEENLIEGEINYESLKDGDGVIYTYPSYAEESGIKVGEKINLTIYDGSKTFEKEFVVEAMCYVGGSAFIVPNNVMDELIKTDITSAVDILVDKDSIDSIEKNLKSIADGNAFIELTTLSGDIEMYEDMLALMKILGYSLVIIIGAIGFMNLINTMITSIITRKRELGMLQAIGLSNKQLVKMLQIEGLFYTLGTLFITLTLGNVFGYIAFAAFKNSGASYAVYNYPLSQTIILIIAVTGAQLLLTYFVSNNFNKESLVDRVRYSE